MNMLLIMLALIGPILPTPVPLMTFVDFRADVAGRDVVAVSWSGTGGTWCLSSSIETFCQRFPAGFYRTSMYARWGDTVVLRDEPNEVLASARVIGRVWLPVCQQLVNAESTAGAILFRNDEHTRRLSRQTSATGSTRNESGALWV